MSLEDTYSDFEYLNSLPGRKLVLKGNHDYWWTTLAKMKKYLEENNFDKIDFLYNNSYIYEDKIICGTRGWEAGANSEDRKILRRENLRLEMSLEDGVKKYGDDKEIIVCMHYPPFSESDELEYDLIATMKKYNVKKCIFGHIHGGTNVETIQGNVDGIEFKLVSSDFLDFKLIKI